MNRRSKQSRSRREGYILIVTCLSLLVITGIAGIAVDLGRIYIAKNEGQSFADSAAISATLQLDGTSAGITRAQAAVTNAATGTNALKWDMATKTITNITVSFAKGYDNTPNTPDSSTWSTNPVDPTHYRFTRVVAGVDVPLTFMQAFYAYSNRNSPGSSTVNVTGTAGQMLFRSFPAGLLPFSPIAPAPTTPPDFGFTTSTTSTPALYTIRYPSGGGLNKGNVCSADQNQTYWSGVPAQDRGYWGSNSASALRGEIIDDNQVQVIQIGQPVPMVGGNKNTEGSALDARVLEDSDSTSPDYTSYMTAGKGNGRRIVGLPINNGPNNFDAVGVGAFFLQPAGVYSAVTGSTPICAEYIGPWAQGGMYGGVGTNSTADTGGYLIRLVQ